MLIASVQAENDAFEAGNVRARLFKGTTGEGADKRKIIKRLINILKIGGLIIRFRPDRIICGSQKELLWLSWLLARVMTVPLIASRHGALQKAGRKLPRKLVQLAEMLCYRLSQAVICHGPYLRDQFIQEGIAAEKVLEFDVGFADFEKLAQDHGLLEKRNHQEGAILYAGRIEKFKGIYDLAEAYRKIRPRFPNTKLIYIGTGSELTRLIRWVEQQSLGRTVLVLGPQSHDEVAAAMAHATVVVTPTRSNLEASGFDVLTEDRCMVAMESLFWGTPVIAPDSGPSPYLITHGLNGLFYRTGSVDALADALANILEAPGLIAALVVGCRQEKHNLATFVRSFSGAVHEGFGSGGDRR